MADHENDAPVHIAAPSNSGEQQKSLIRHKTITMSVTGSLADFARAEKALADGTPLSEIKNAHIDEMGIEACHNTFGITGLDPSRPNAKHATLDNLLFIGVTAVETSSTAPIAMAVDLNPITKGNSYGKAGRAALYLHANSKNNSERIMLSEIDEVSSDFADRFPGFNANNIETKAVNKLTNTVLVGANHPVMTVIKDNLSPAEFHAIASQNLVDNQFHTLSKELFDTAIDCVRNDVAKNIPQKDLSKGLRMSIRRADGRNFTATNGLPVAKDEAKDFVNQPFTITVSMKMAWENSRD